MRSQPDQPTARSTSTGDVAIVGMACVFPKAPNLAAYWENIVSKVSAIDEPPDDWGADVVFDPDSQENDRIYCKRGGYLGDLSTFNPLEHGVMPVAVDGAEPEHFMALRVAHEALADAGFPDRPLNTDRTEVIIGRGTFVNRGYVTLLQHGFVLDQTIRLLSELHPEYTPAELASLKRELKSSLPPFNAETSPGLAHSVLAGLIANRHDLKGAAYVVDAACASCMMALEQAVTDLRIGRCDAVLTGGIQISTPPLIHMLFTQLGALSHRPALSPFGEDADGTMLGEGVGMMVLKRLEDAERDGNRVYAVIKGVGSSSDGRAKGLLAPRVEGEALAMQRAYESTGIDPRTVELIEAHGTGIPLGDAAEIESLRTVFGTGGPETPRCALGTVKSMIGHLIPAAGIAGLIKAALSLHHRVLPPTLAGERPNPGLKLETTPFYLNTETRPWIHGSSRAKRRAGVNAFGFGGINAHVILEEHEKDGQGNGAGLLGRREAEVLLFDGDSREDLVDNVASWLRHVEASPADELLDVAYSANSRLQERPWRLAMVASSREDLARKLTHAVKRLTDPECRRIKERSGIYFFEEPIGRNGKLAFLFPGEGSQYANMLSDLCMAFPEVRRAFDVLDAAFADHPRQPPPSQAIFPLPANGTGRGEAETRLWQMDVAVDAVITADRALFHLLERLGLRAHMTVGHSSGEFMALEAAGALQIEDEEELVRLTLAGQERIERLQRSGGVPSAVLTAVGAANRELMSATVAEGDGRLFLAMDNCPNQFVICGDEEVTDKAVARLRASRAICQRLMFDRPYHTPLFEAASDPLRAFAKELRLVRPRTEVFSSATADRMPSEPEAIRALTVEQWARPVRFRETIEAMYDAGARIFLEVGPGANLTGFVSDTLKGKDVLALASNVRHRSGLMQLGHSLALLFAHGVPMKLDYLYAGRRARQTEPRGPEAALVVGEETPGAPKLSLALPTLRLSPDGARAKGRAVLAAKHAEVEERSVDEPVREGSALAVSEPRPQPPKGAGGGDGARPGPAPTRAPGQTARTDDHGTSVMQEFMETMGEFLDVQRRVMEAYLRDGSPEAARGSAVRFEPPPAMLADIGGPEAESSSTRVPQPAHAPGAELSVETTVLGGEAPHVLPSSVEPSPSAPPIETLLLALVSDKTGYPTEMLRLEQRLEADLGISSIKRVEILGALMERIQAPEGVDLERLTSLETLGEIVESLSSPLDDGSPSDAGDGEARTATTSGPPASREASSAIHPLVGKIVRSAPGQELVTVRVLDLKTDTFLTHHTLGGRVSREDETLLGLPLVPFSISLEAMAEAAARLRPDQPVIELRDCSAHRWIALEGEAVTLEAVAKASEDPTEIRVQLKVLDSATSKKAQLAAEATVRFGREYPKAPEPVSLTLCSETEPDASLQGPYPGALFHGPSFQTVASVGRLGGNGIVADLMVPRNDGLFRDAPEPTLLTDPILLDGAGQVIGLWALSTLPEGFIVFPSFVGEVKFYGPPLRPSERTRCLARTRLAADGHILSDLSLLTSNGSLQMQVLGLKHRRMDIPRLFHLFRGSRDVMLTTPCDPEEAGVPPRLDRLVACRMDQIPETFWEIDDRIWRTVLAHIVLSRREREAWRSLGGSEAHRTEWLLGRAAAKDAVRLWMRRYGGRQAWPADIEIRGNDGGHVVVASADGGQEALDVSVSRRGGVIVALAAEAARPGRPELHTEGERVGNSGHNPLGATARQERQTPTEMG